jgi:hypothetical protein
MKFRHLGVALIGIGLITGAASAQGIDQRHDNQQHRIAQGVHSGELTPGEAHRLERQQRSIDRQEARMRYRHGGRLSAHDRWVLRHRENRASAHIYHAKHNGRVG